MKSLAIGVCLAAVTSEAAVRHGRSQAQASSDDSSLRGRRPAHLHIDEQRPPEEVQQEVEAMMTRVEKMGDSKLTENYVDQLEKVEAKLAEHVGAAGSFASNNLVQEIGSVRAHLCVEQGFERHESADCENFMRVACSLQGNASNVPSPKGSAVPITFTSCQQFFAEQRREVGQEEPAAEAEGEGEEAAAAEGEGEGGNATEGGDGLFGGKKERDLPEQGYNEYIKGKKVQHDNLETQTGDWQKEGRGRDIEAICKEFPDNQWCQLHTQKDEPYVAPPPPKSGAQGRFAVWPIVVACLAAPALRV